MAHELDYAPPPHKETSLLGEILLYFFALGTITYTIMCHIWYWENPTPIPSDRVMLVVLTGLSVFQVLFLALKVYLVFHPPRRRARALLDLYTRLFSAEPEWVPVDPRQVPRTNLRQLERLQKAFAAAGWTFAGDYENAGLRSAEPTSRICCRLMTDGTGECVAAFYAGRYRRHLQLLLLLVRKRRGFRACSIETFLSDGITLVTCFPSGHSGRAQPWQLAHVEPWTAGVPALVARHRRELTAYLASHPGVQVLAAPTTARWLELLAAAVRRTNAHYKETGYLTPDDLRRMFGPKGNAAKQLIPALEQILYEEHRKQAASPQIPPPLPQP